MKTNFFVNKLLMLLLLVGGFTLISCNESLVNEEVISQDEINVMQQNQSAPAMFMLPVQNSYCGEPVVNILYAGQHIESGNLEIANDENFLYVTYNTQNGWVLKHTHLYVGSMANLPVNKKGNPQIGHFPYQTAHSPYVTSFTYTIPLEGLDECVIVAAHAEVLLLDDNGEVIQEETAWGNGTPFVSQGSWAMYGEYCLQKCEDDDDPTEARSETAFAFGGEYANCFLDYGFNRWGWTNGELTEGTYTFDIYAAAGQCDLSKGTYVGLLYVNYSNGQAVITYSMFEGFTMTENHLYADNEMFPLKNGVETVAPGQYPIVVGNLSDSETSYTITNLSGPIYVIAHAVVEWEEEVVNPR